MQRRGRKHLHEILYNRKFPLYYDNKEMRLYNGVDANA